MPYYDWYSPKSRCTGRWSAASTQSRRDAHAAQGRARRPVCSAAPWRARDRNPAIILPARANSRCASGAETPRRTPEGSRSPLATVRRPFAPHGKRVCRDEHGRGGEARAGGQAHGYSNPAMTLAARSRSRAVQGRRRNSSSRISLAAPRSSRKSESIVAPSRASRAIRATSLL